jgi:hypothetical protein
MPVVAVSSTCPRRSCQQEIWQSVQNPIDPNAGIAQQCDVVFFFGHEKSENTWFALST